MKLLSTTSESRTPVVVYVGCNKGDDFINTVRVWTRDEKYSVQTLYNWMKEVKTFHFACGKDSDVSLNTLPKEKLPVMGYCIEPMESTIEMLQSAFNDLGYNEPNIKLIHAAASNYAGTAKFPNISNKAGYAGFGLHDASTGKHNTTSVQVITLDGFIRAEQIQKIDYLSIDTEGNDMQVLLGAIHLLSAHAIRYFEFEAHEKARWNTSSLRDLIELVDSMGYDCYWAMISGKLARITGCWSDVYLLKRWSNVVCISRRDTKVHEFMESLSVIL